MVQCSIRLRSLLLLQSTAPDLYSSRSFRPFISCPIYLEFSLAGSTMGRGYSTPTPYKLGKLPSIHRITPLLCLAQPRTPRIHRDCTTRDLAFWMDPDQEGGRWYEVLNLRETGGIRTVPLNVLLFRARDVEGVPMAYRKSNYSHGAAAVAALVEKINARGVIYVSPGGYPGGAIRIAVSNWLTGHNDGGADLIRTKSALRDVMQ